MTETRFANNRLGFDFAYYNTNSYDQILPVLVTPFTGVTRMWVNGGQIENKGFEITLLTTPVQKKDWRWDLNVNWWRNRNEVIELFEGVDNLLIYSHRIFKSTRLFGRHQTEPSAIPISFIQC